MVKINLKNQNKKRKIDLLRIEKRAKKVLLELGKKDSEVNIVFLSNQNIRVLNRKYLNRDKSTDVIAFPHVKGKNDLKMMDHFLGDIAISSDKAEQNAKRYKVSFFDEITLYVIHGILHLLGYDDILEKNRIKMKKEENGLLQKTKKIS